MTNLLGFLTLAQAQRSFTSEKLRPLTRSDKLLVKFPGSVKSVLTYRHGVSSNDVLSSNLAPKQQSRSVTLEQERGLAVVLS